jgi:hypothetical protein
MIQFTNPSIFSVIFSLTFFTRLSCGFGVEALRLECALNERLGGSLVDEKERRDRMK